MLAAAFNCICSPVLRLRLVCTCRKKQSAYKFLMKRIERHDKVASAAHKMAYQKEVMGKGRKRKLRPEELGKEPGDEGSASVYKWKRERKK